MHCIFVIHGADPFAVKELALVYLAIFVLMYIAGPGNYSVDRLIAKKSAAGNSGRIGAMMPNFYH